MDDNKRKIEMTQGSMIDNEIEENIENKDNNFYEQNIEIPIKSSESEYDDFMFEPLGFEELDKQYETDIMSVVRYNMKKSKRQKKIIILLVLIFIAVISLGVYSIISDISESKNYSSNNSGNKNVVLYQSAKPNNTNLKYIDENGKYSTEGVAAVVRPSVIEIYTYKDSAHSDLSGTGSGIIISDDGYIVTNAHVLDAEGYHVVKTYDDKAYDADIIGRDSKTDIAVIKIKASNLKPAVLGNSDEVVVGEEVMAIGNPAGLSGTVTNGIVSAVNRKIRGKTTAFEMDCIQTNADISPGNSGGALVNMYAQVIGITSSKYASDALEGLGFAISINEAKPIIEELISNGFISGRFKIGITLMATDDEQSRMAVESDLGYKLPEDFNGVYIVSIVEDCDIANTDLKAKDFIIKVEGKTVANYDSLYSAIKNFSAGDTVKAECANVDKDGNIKTYDIEFELMPDTSGDY